MKRLLATRKGYCLALVTIRRSGNNSQVSIQELWWLTGLVFYWQQMMMAGREPLLRLILKSYAWFDMALALRELAAVVWTYEIACASVKLEVVGIVMRSLWWALSPRLL